MSNKIRNDQEIAILTSEQEELQINEYANKRLIQFRGESGNYDRKLFANTHKWLSGRAFGALVFAQGRDFLVPIINRDQQDEVTEWSCKPDELETDEGRFYGHFFDAETGKNYNDQTSPTAQERALYHYELALDIYPETSLSKDARSWCQELGMALHYLQDATAPHHAANHPVSFTSIDHFAFESYVSAEGALSFGPWENIVGQLGDLSVKGGNGKTVKINYDGVKTMIASHYRIDLTVPASTNAKRIYRKWKLNDPAILRNWNGAATEALGWAQGFSVMFLYQFILEARKKLNWNININSVQGQFPGGVTRGNAKGPEPMTRLKVVLYAQGDVWYSSATTFNSENGEFEVSIVYRPRAICFQLVTSDYVVKECVGSIPKVGEGVLAQSNCLTLSLPS